MPIMPIVFMGSFEKGEVVSVANITTVPTASGLVLIKT
jgi:hypothetical protein